MSDQSSALIDVDDLVAEIARARLKRHVVAAAVRLHPTYLGQILNGHRNLTPEVAIRIQGAVRTLRKPRA